MITREEAIKELERELKMRERVYPNMIMRGKINRAQAERQYLKMKAAINYLKGDVEKLTGKQPKLF